MRLLLVDSEPYAAMAYAPFIESFGFEVVVINKLEPNEEDIITKVQDVNYALVNTHGHWQEEACIKWLLLLQAHVPNIEIGLYNNTSVEAPGEIIKEYFQYYKQLGLSKVVSVCNYPVTPWQIASMLKSFLKYYKTQTT